MQDGNYSDVNRETGKRATIAELIKFGADELKLDYIFWCTQEPHYSNELIPFMRAARHALGEQIVQPGKGTFGVELFGSSTRSVDVILAQTNQISSRQRRLNRSQTSLRDGRITHANLSRP